MGNMKSKGDHGLNKGSAHVISGDAETETVKAPKSKVDGTRGTSNVFG